MMHQPLPEAPDHVRWLERANDDFPFYRGKPVMITGGQWWFVVLSVAVGFLALIYSQPIFPTGILGFIPAILFVAIPLVALSICAGSGWKALFRRLRPVDFLWMFLFFILNYVVTIILGTLAVAMFAAEANPAGEIIQSSGSAEKVLFFLKAAVQLLGEELLVILPFLALLYWLVSKCGMGRTMAVALSALAVSVGFALVHLPTYQWNYGQALLGLVPIRIVLLLPYILTKNVWVSTGTHIINDWTTFGLPLLLAGAVES